MKQMKISDNILVGVEFPKLCEYYHDVRAYANELNEQFEDSIHEVLIGLSAYIVDNKDMLRVDYYTETQDGRKQYTYYTDKEGKDVSWTQCIINKHLEAIESEIKSQDHIYDLDHFLKNN